MPTLLSLPAEILYDVFDYLQPVDASLRSIATIHGVTHNDTALWLLWHEHAPIFGL
jgi:hypothetical protein